MAICPRQRGTREEKILGKLYIHVQIDFLEFVPIGIVPNLVFREIVLALRWRRRLLRSRLRILGGILQGPSLSSHSTGAGAASRR